MSTEGFAATQQAKLSTSWSSRLFLAAVLAACAATVHSQAIAAGSCPDAPTITTPTTIAANDLTYDNKNVVVQGTTLTIVGPHAFCNLTVQSGGVVDHVAEDTAGLGLSLANGTVDGSSAITVTGRGYGGGSGAGSPGNGAASCGGAAYGGDGGDGTGSAGSHAFYGSIDQPTSLGSGGGWNSSSSEGGAGGGAMHLVVSGTLQVDGVLRADGGNGTGSGGGGSGGSVWLEVGGLEGAGVISASGGSTGSGGGGSGGRVAIYTNDCYGNFDAANRVFANGGAGAGVGGTGTILLGYQAHTAAGAQDWFLAPTEPASPSANLVAGLSGETLVPFDAFPTEGAFAHTFTGIPPLTRAARLVLRARAGSGVNVAADKITLGYSDANGFTRVWSRYLGSTNGNGDPSGLTGRPWVNGGRDTALILDVAALPRVSGSPVDLTGLLSVQGHLDVVVEGNTAVDFALLTFGSCPNYPVGVDDPRPPIPTVVALRSAPNPFTDRAVVSFDLPRESRVSLAAFDLSGRRVQTIFEGTARAGRHQVDWDVSPRGGRLGPGVYFLRLETDGNTLMRKLLLVR